MSVLPRTPSVGELLREPTSSAPPMPPAVRGRTLHVVPARCPLPPVVGADLIVPTLTGPVPYANLDHAASTPALQSVKEAVDQALVTYASVHRGAGYASRLTSAWYEQARAEVAAFVGARDDDTVLFTRTTTDSWALLSKALPAHTTVFVFETEHHSTLLPWGRYRTVRLPVPKSVEDAVQLLDDALVDNAAAHASRHRLVVISGASNVTGETWPVERFAELAHRHGARIAVDAAQLSAHRPIDLSAWGADYVAFSGHKTYAPFGAGVLAGRSDWLDAGTPYLFGGGATASVTDEGTRWATGPARHEGGSPNVIGAIAIAAACATIAANRGAIEAHEAALLAQLREGLEAVDGVELLSIFDDDHDRVGVVAFTLDGWDSSLVSQVLAVEHGIGVRDGKFCAHLLVDELLDDPWRERSTSAVRVSLGLGSTSEAVDRLVCGIRTLVEHGTNAAWARGDRGWELRGQDDPRDAPAARPW